MWVQIAKYAFQLAILAVGKVSPEQWSKLGVVVQAWLQEIVNRLPAGHPLITMTSSFRAPLSKMTPVPKSDTDLWGN